MGAPPVRGREPLRPFASHPQPTEASRECSASPGRGEHPRHSADRPAHRGRPGRRRHGERHPGHTPESHQRTRDLARQYGRTDRAALRLGTRSCRAGAPRARRRPERRRRRGADAAGSGGAERRRRDHSPAPGCRRCDDVACRHRPRAAGRHRAPGSRRSGRVVGHEQPAVGPAPRTRMCPCLRTGGRLVTPHRHAPPLGPVDRQHAG